MTMDRAFPSIHVNEKSGKPRDRQLTMMVDFGLPLGATADLLELAHDAIDLAKVAVGTAALYSKELLARKLSLYRDHSIIAFTGGQFLEYAIHRNLIDEYLRDAVDSGFAAVEVSDNLLEISPARKHEIIAHAHEAFGLKVLGEVGSKSESSDVDGLIEDALGCLRAGAWKVLFEAAEFFESGSFRDDLAERVLADVPTEEVIFELPGSWIAGVAASDIHDMQVWLLERVGPEVNVGNVAPHDIVSFEALRRNLGVKMSFD